MTIPAGEGVNPENTSGENQIPNNSNPNSNNSDGGSDNAKLVQENKKYRERAQAAEKALSEKETAYTELKSTYEKLQGDVGELTKKVETFVFKEAKQQAIKEFVASLPDGKSISNMASLEKHVDVLSNSETLKNDIENFAKDLVVDGPIGTQLTFGKTPAPQNGDIKIDLSDPHSMLKQMENNPQGFKEALAKSNSAPLQGFNVSVIPGQNQNHS